MRRYGDTDGSLELSSAVSSGSNAAARCLPEQESHEIHVRRPRQPMRHCWFPTQMAAVEVGNHVETPYLRQLRLECLIL